MPSAGAVTLEFIGEGITELTKQVQSLAEAVNSMSDEQKTARANSNRHGQAMDKSAKAATRLGKGMKFAAGTVAGLLTATVASTRVLGTWAQQGGKALTMLDAFQRQTGAESITAGLNSARAATAGLIDEFALLEQYNRGAALGAFETQEQFNQMARAATQLGRAMNVDARFALESLTLGIGRQSRLFLDNLGLIVKVEEAYRRYGLAVGKAGDQLTEAEQKEAFRIESLRKMAEAMEDLGPITLNAGDAFTQFSVSMRDAITRGRMWLAQSDLLKDAFQSMSMVLRGMFTQMDAGEQAIMDNIGRSDNVEQLTAQLERYKAIYDQLPAGVDWERVLGAKSLQNFSAVSGRTAAMTIEQMVKLRNTFAGVAQFAVGQGGAGALKTLVPLLESLSAHSRQVVQDMGPITEMSAQELINANNLRNTANQIDDLVEMIRDGSVDAEKAMVRLKTSLEKVMLNLDASTGMVTPLDFGIEQEDIERLSVAGLNTYADLAERLSDIGRQLEGEGLSTTSGLVEVIDALEQRIRELDPDLSIDADQFVPDLSGISTSVLRDRLEKIGSSIRGAEIEIELGIDEEKREEASQSLQRLRRDQQLLYDEIASRGDLSMIPAVWQAEVEQAVPAVRKLREEHAQWLEQLASEVGVSAEALRGMEEYTEVIERQTAATEALVDVAESVQTMKDLERTWDFLQRPGRFSEGGVDQVLADAEAEAARLEERLRSMDATNLDQSLIEPFMELTDQLNDVRDFIDDIKDARMPLLKKLQTLFTGSIDSLFARDNLNDMIVNGVGGLITGGLSTLLSGLADGFLGLFEGGPDYERMSKDQIDALRENTLAIKRMARNMSGSALGRLPAAIEAVASLIEQTGGAQNPSVGTELRGDLIRTLLDRMGVSFAEFESVLSDMGVTFDEATTSAEVLREAVEQLADRYGDLSGRMDLMNAMVEIMDVEDPAQKFEMQMRAMLDSIRQTRLGELYQEIIGTGPEEFAAQAQEWLNEIQSGTFDVGALGDVTEQEFIDWIVGMDRFADEVEEAADGLGELGEQLRNVPTGFKVALAQFRADTGEFRENEGKMPPVVANPFITLDESMVENYGKGAPSGGGYDYGPDGGDMLGRGEPSGHGRGEGEINIDVVYVVANDPQEMLRKLEEQARIEKRRGGTTLGDAAFRSTSPTATKGGFR